MANQLRIWIGVVVLGCVTVAVAYLPPRAMLTVEDSTYPVAFVNHSSATRALRSAEWYLGRLELFEELASTHVANQVDRDTVYTLRVDPTLPQRVEDVSRTLLNAMAARVTMGANPVLVVIRVDTTSHWWSSPLEYALPENGGDPCLAIVELNSAAVQRINRGRIAVDGVQPGPVPALLGPCAYYAVFGDPGPHVSNWLERTGYSAAMLPNWIADQRHTAPISIDHDIIRDRIESLDLFSCAAGSRGRCKRAVFHQPTLATWSSGWDLRPRRLTSFPRRALRSRNPLGLSEIRYLSDLVTDRGRDRFARFWTSDLPVDSAFANAFGIPIEDWTMQWARAQFGIPRRGPNAPLSSTLFSLSIAGLFVAVAAAFATRRQVA